MPAPADLRYTQTHEWVRMEGDTAVIGITDFAVKAIKEIVFLDLPAQGKDLSALKPFGAVESVKAVFDLNSPVAGKVAGVNAAAAVDFNLLTGDPYGKGWLIKVKPVTGQPALLDSAAYEAFCAQEHH